SGYQQKDRKPSQNDKTEHGMEKTVQNQGQKSKNAKVRVNTEESAVKPEPELKNTIGCNLNPSDGPGKPNRSGYQQKDRKPSQNDKTEHGMEKTVQNQGQSPKMPKSESILKNQQSNRSRN
ncbi:hypothetical protein Tco_1048089, partial [Tanacetum coccineum]